jgi:hypothetical protein
VTEIGSPRQEGSGLSGFKGNKFPDLRNYSELKPFKIFIVVKWEK